MVERAEQTEVGRNRQTPRIQDVARVAGVSTATVIRALSKPELVSDASLEAVVAAVRETGYRINPAARNLRQRPTMAVFALVPNSANPLSSKANAVLQRQMPRQAKAGSGPGAVDGVSR